MTDEFIPHEMPGLAAWAPALNSLVQRAGVAAEVSKDTESPIETFFGVEAIRLLAERYQTHPKIKFAKCRSADEAKYPRDHVLLMPQYCWRNYRIDWVIKATNLKHPYFVVECDGREFHSSDRQLASDAARDKEMMEAGLWVFRFSGAEIFKSAPACVLAVVGAIQSRSAWEWKSNRGAS